MLKFGNIFSTIYPENVSFYSYLYNDKFFQRIVKFTPLKLSFYLLLGKNLKVFLSFIL